MQLGLRGKEILMSVIFLKRCREKAQKTKHINTARIARCHLFIKLKCITFRARHVTKPSYL